MIYYLLRNMESDYCIICGIPHNPNSWSRLDWTSSLEDLLESLPIALAAGTNSSYFESWKNIFNAQYLEEAIQAESEVLQQDLLTILLETSDPTELTFENINQNYPELLL